MQNLMVSSIYMKCESICNCCTILTSIECDLAKVVSGQHKMKNKNYIKRVHSFPWIL